MWRYRRVWFLFGLLAFTALAGAVWVVTQVPLPSEAPLAQTTLIFDGKGDQVAELHGTENRYPVTIDQVPPVAQAAVIAAEDRKFLEHRGVDPLSIARATWADIRKKGAVQGGSTITQQYVKNQFVGSDRTLVRKLKEAVIAIKLERKYDKRTILEKYLNTVYFGRGAYGIQAAAQAYFGKDVGELDLRDSAYLAGLIRTPSNGDVFVDADSAYYLRTSVLRNMVRDETITQSQADEVEATRIESYVFPPEPADTTFTRPNNGVEYFVEYVRQELVETYGEDRVLRGGLRVYTTLDPDAQAVAYSSVYDTLNDPENDPAGALVSLDREGRVVAMVGGRDWALSKVNLAVGEEGGGGGRHGGSAFKPFVLAEAVRQGISLENEWFNGADKLELPGWEHEVSNYDGASYGYLNLTDATVNSVNTVYAQLVNRVGGDNVVRMARDMGIRSELRGVPSITLGTQNVSALDMANAYLTIANDGVRNEARVISRVVEGSTVLVDDKPRGRTRVLPRDVAEQVKSVLTEVVERGSGVRAQLPDGAVWGKTGTSENYGDAWFVGGHQKLVTAVWMGYPEGQSREMRNVHGVVKVAGGTLPAFIFRSFMGEADPGDGTAVPKPVLDARQLNSSSPVPTVAPAGADDDTVRSSPATSTPPTTEAPAAPSTTVETVPEETPPPTRTSTPDTTTPTAPDVDISVPDRRVTPFWPPGFPAP